MVKKFKKKTKQTTAVQQAKEEKRLKELDSAASNSEMKIELGEESKQSEEEKVEEEANDTMVSE
jgi:hypothetical protein